jgi:hypothetical protein
MRLGLDFDNTIACYTTIFHQLAVGRGLVAAEPLLSKSQVRDLLRAQGREAEWTELQGSAYGPGMAEVESFAGAAECIRTLLCAGVDVCIISHKTRTPYRGQAWDLHDAAQSWLQRQGFFDAGRVGLSRDSVFFELTLAEKLGRIAQQRCTHFLDDLPEVLHDPAFPENVYRLLFDPDDVHADGSLERIRTWPELATWMLNRR